jgi:hypothetical protein
MQQRQPRLGDVLDDYCPRERRLTNHAVVAMVGEDIKQTRCMTCDAEHEYKHAKVPRQRRKGSETAALYSQVLAGAPKRVAHDPAANGAGADEPASPVAQEPEPLAPSAPLAAAPQDIPPADDSEAPADITDDERADDTSEEGPVHRPLIRATLPRQEGQVPPPRPAPDFTIRQPGGGRPNRFRPRNQRGGGAVFQGNRGNGGNATGSSRNGAQRFPGNSNRPPQGGGPGRRGNQQRQNRKRFK